jgi:glycosyltransferase involved in cell wall biosynthesis
MTALTIFTPVYNGADTLAATYASLERQNTRDFTWLVIDDGSTDATGILVQEWQRHASFEIEYVYQRNAGKHNAHNEAVSRATTELFLILDADDELTPDAVETITAEWRRVRREGHRDVVGVWTLCRTPEGSTCGVPFPAERLDTSLQELRYRYKCEGERLPCFTTQILREHTFPRTPPGCCAFIPEAYVWAAITRNHRLRCLNVVCRVYHQGIGLSAMSRNEYRVSRSIVYGYAGPLMNDLSWFRSAPGFFFFNAAQTVRYGVFSRRLFSILGDMPWSARLLLLVSSPLGLALLVRDYLSGRISRQCNDENTHFSA